jgi:hypothetical protein
VVKTKNFGDGETTNENVVWNIHTRRKARCVENPQCAKEIDWISALSLMADELTPYLRQSPIPNKLLERLGAKDVSRVVLWTYPQRGGNSQAGGRLPTAFVVWCLGPTNTPIVNGNRPGALSRGHRTMGVKHNAAVRQRRRSFPFGQQASGGSGRRRFLPACRHGLKVAGLSGANLS